MKVCAFSQIAPRALEWLWPGRLALGKVAVLDGDPGLGKSFLTLDICARLSRGRPFPDGAPSPGPANALILNGEDCPQDTMRQRLVDLDADLDRVFFHKEDDLLKSVSFPSDTKWLHRALTRTRAKLLVIDPIMAFLDANISSVSDQSVRRALGPLRRLSRLHHCATQLVRHLNKRPGLRAVYRGVGSIGIIGSGRIASLVGRDPVKPGVCVLAQAKSNLAEAAPSLAYRLQGTEDGRVIVDWLGRSPWTADDLTAVPQRVRARDQARNFLLAALADGPRLAREVGRAAHQLGLSDSTMHRAKQELQVSTRRFRVNGRPVYYWVLPTHVIPPQLLPDEDDLEPWLAPMRKEFAEEEVDYATRVPGSAASYATPSG